MCANSVFVWLDNALMRSPATHLIGQCNAPFLCTVHLKMQLLGSLCTVHVEMHNYAQCTSKMLQFLGFLCTVHFKMLEFLGCLCTRHFQMLEFLGFKCTVHFKMPKFSRSHRRRGSFAPSPGQALQCSYGFARGILIRGGICTFCRGVAFVLGFEGLLLYGRRTQDKDNSHTWSAFVALKPRNNPCAAQT